MFGEILVKYMVSMEEVDESALELLKEVLSKKIRYK